jgi:ankyrin repeat protein
MILYALEKGMDVNQSDEVEQCTPLWLAALFGYTDVARLLLANDGMDANRGFQSPLILAAEHGHEDTVRVLLGHPAVNPFLTAFAGVCFEVFETHSTSLSAMATDQRQS